MDIDVAEQLFPNILTIVTQLCATGILLYFVTKFLWEPGREMLAKRQTRMQDQLDDAEKLKAEAADDRASANAELKDMQSRVKTMMETAKSDANDEKERILKEADRQAQAKLDRASETIEKQKAEMRADIQKEIVDVALAASTKLMDKEDLEEQDQRALESFVKEIQDESGR